MASSSKEMSLRKEIKQFLKDFCDGFTMHGFRHIVSSEWLILKLCWTLFVTGFVAYCSYMTVQSINTFFLYKVVTNQYQEYEKQPKFPTVTICNLNSFDVSSNNFTGDYINKVLIKNGINPTINPEKNAYKSLELINKVLKASIIGDKNLTNDQLQSIGFSLQNMLLSCTFNGVICDANDFIWFYNYKYGNCYTFNSNKFLNGTKRIRRTTTKSGPGTGLVLELFAGIPDEDYYLLEKGFYVLVNDHFEKYLVNYDGIKVPTGKSSEIEVGKKNVSRMPHPYSTCRKELTPIETDSIYYNLTSQIGTYNRKLCIDIYFQISLVIPKCNCFDASVERFTNQTETCMDIKQLECVANLSQYMNEFVSEQNCPEECDLIHYMTNVNFANYPTEFYGDLLNSNENVNSLFVPTYNFTPSNVTTINPLTIQNIAVTIPNVDVTIPNVDIKKLNIAVTVPEVIVTVPDVPVTVPDVPVTVPDVPVTVPDVPVEIPNIAVTVPNIAVTVPDVPVTVPDIAVTVPKVVGSVGSLTPSPVVDQGDLKNSLALIKVSLESLSYTAIYEQPTFTFETLLGVIGGQFGLFIGASLLSFIEVLFMIFSLIVKVISYCTRANKKAVRLQPVE